MYFLVLLIYRWLSARLELLQSCSKPSVCRIRTLDLLPCDIVQMRMCYSSSMMTSSNGTIFRITGHLCGEFTGPRTTQRPGTRSCDVFFDLRLNKWLSKQSWGWWFETLSRPLWRHCDALILWLSTEVKNVDDLEPVQWFMALPPNTFF